MMTEAKYGFEAWALQKKRQKYKTEEVLLDVFQEKLPMDIFWVLDWLTVSQPIGLTESVVQSPF